MNPSRWLLAGLAFALSAQALAQSYPSRPIRFLVPYAAGGSTDVVARSISGTLQQALGQPLLVDNRPGGAEVLATDILAKSTADGHVIAMISNTFAINDSFARKLPYDSRKDFVGVAKLVDVPFGMFVTPSLPATTVKEFVDYAKANPGKLNYAHVGVGTPHFLTMEWFKQVAGLNIVGVGYKGAADAFTAMTRGDVHIFTSGLGGGTPFVRSGKVRAIANASPRRVATLPDLPTLKESGYADFDLTSWFGIIAPRGTPPAVVERLNAEFNRAILAADVKQRLESFGLEPSTMSAREFDRYMRDEIDRWGKVVKSTGVKSE